MANVPQESERIEYVEEDRSINLFAALYRLLRKRMKLAMVLALIGIVLGAMAAIAAPAGKYRSVGMIQIRPNVPRILFETEQTGVMPMFQSFVDSQLTLIKSEPVVDMAMNHPEWHALYPARTPEAVAAFGDAIEVRRPKNSELIEVVFSHKDPDVAMVGMHALIGAYMRLHGDPNAEAGAQTLKFLEERQNALGEEQERINKEINKIAEGYGTAELEQLFQSKRQEVDESRANLRKIEMTIASIEARLEQVPTGDAPADLTIEMIAAHDELMKRKLEQKMELELEVQQLSITFRENHKKLAGMRALLKSLNEQIEQYADVYRQMPNTIDEKMPTQKGLERNRRQEKTVRRFYDKASAELAELGNKNLQIQKLRTQLAKVDKDLEETNRRIEQLEVESAASGRIEIVNEGNRPVKREGDKRVVWGGAGAVAGGLFGVGLIALVGILDRRVHNIKDTRDTFGGDYRLLGAVPVLTADSTSAEESQSAAHAVHRIRAMLQLRASLDRRVFTMTSPVAGSGKTSLTSALGLSLAGSNSKTLLIDCDVIGGALSIRMNTIVRRKFGQICLRQGLMNEEQLERALQAAQRMQCRLGEAMVRMSLLTEADVAEALTLQNQSAVGLFNVLGGETLMDCVAPTRTPGLWVLPLGTSGSRYAAQLSPMAIRKLVLEARQHFDVVLIDTGPILGSLDASIVAAESDEVMLVLSRGDDRFLVHKALDELESLGAQILGLIFNRADEHDVNTAGMSMTVSVARMRLNSKGMLAVDGNTDGGAAEGPHLGPIAMAIDLNGGKGENGNGHGKGSGNGNGSHGGAGRERSGHLGLPHE